MFRAYTNEEIERVLNLLADIEDEPNENNRFRCLDEAKRILQGKDVED